MMGILKKKGLFLLNKVDDGTINPSDIVLDLPLSGNTNDISGNNHTVVDNSIIYYPDGALFDLKTTDYIRVDDNNDLSFTTGTNDKPFSVSFDVIFDDFTSTRRLICKGNSSGGYEYYLQFWNGRLGLLLFNGGTGARYVYKILNTNIFTLGLSYNITVTYDGRGGVNAMVGINIYINGELRVDVTSVPDTQYVCMSNTNSKLCIGHLEGETSLVFIGSIKNVKIYKISLSQLQVTNLQPISNVEPNTTKLYVPYYGNTKSLISSGSAHDYLTKPRWLTNTANGVYQQITGSTLSDLTFYSGTTDLPFSISFKYNFGIDSNVSWFNKSNGTNVEYSIRYDTVLGVVVVLRDNNNNAEYNYNKYFTPIIGQNYLFAITYGGGVISLYINGILQIATTEAKSGGYISISPLSGGTQQVNILRRPINNNQIVNCPLTSSEVITTYPTSHDYSGFNHYYSVDPTKIDPIYGALYDVFNPYDEVASASDLIFGNGTTDLPFSFSVKTRMTAIPGNDNSCFIQSPNRYCFIYRYSYLHFYLSNVDGLNLIGFRVPFTISTLLNSDHTVGFTYDGSKTINGVKFYFDGILLPGIVSSPEFTSGTYTGMGPTADKITIARNGGGSWNYNGYLRNFHLDSGVNSPEQMLAYYNEPNTFEYLNGSIKNLKIESIAIPQSTVVKYANDAESYRILDMQFNGDNGNISGKHQYGYLYNQYAVDTNKLAPKGWHVPTQTEYETLKSFIGATEPSKKLREVGTTYWSTNDGQDTYGFKLRGSGFRNISSGYVDLKTQTLLWTSTNGIEYDSWWDAGFSFNGYTVDKKTGCSVRCIRDSGNTETTVTDLDGNLYTSVTIGTQTWLVQNLSTTKYNDNTPIPNVTGSTEWGVLTSGAYCSYNNVSSNAMSSDLLSHDTTDTSMTYSNNTAVFNGSASKITIVNSSYLSFTNGTKDLPFSIDIRFTQTVSGSFVLISKDSTISANREWIVNYDSSVSTFYIFFYSVGGIRGVTYNVPIVVGVANRLTVTYDGINLQKVYWNSNLVTAPVYSPGNPGAYTTMNPSVNPVILGQYVGNLLFFNGTIDYCTIYNRVLIQDEIQYGICNVYDGALNLIQNTANTLSWYDFTDSSIITKDGSNYVSAVNDKNSTNRTLIQPTSARKPLWSSNGLLFDGASGINGDHMQYQLPSGNMGSYITVYMVVKQVSYYSAGTLFTMGTPYQLRQLNSTPQIQQIGNNLGSVDSNLTIGTFQVLTVCFNGSNSYVKVGSNNKTVSSNLTTFTPNTFRLGAYPGVDANECYAGNIEVKELIIRTVADTDADALSIQTYLKNKYNL